jgi:Cu(I)/Ag(I) efflux system membrane protein CusA/SilA
VDLETEDIGSYVERAKAAIDRSVDRPAGVSVEWSGQYEYMENAAARLKLLIPITLLLVFVFLHLHFGNLAESLLVMLTLPFALVGGVWLLYLLEYNLSVAVAVGFIALTGLAAETGVVMLVYLDEAVERYRAEGRFQTFGDLREAVVEGAVERVRPKVMTVTTTLVGLLPVMLGSGTGSQIMRRIAAPMVGGLVTSTVLTLVIIPVVYFFYKRVTLGEELSHEGG